MCIRDSGKHVISAVPACCALEEAARMKEVKERTGLKYMMAETSSYRWETITARRLLRDGLLGELIYTEGEYYHPMDKAGRDALWYYNCLLYTSDAADDLLCVDLGGRRIIKKKK